MKQVAGLILAAGKSERMGQPKALLEVLGQTFLSRVYAEAANSDLASVTVILGHGPEVILNGAPAIRSCATVNEDYTQGQLSSIQHGLRTLGSRKVDGAMVLLIDHPFVTRQLINLLIASFTGHSAPIVIPSFHHRRGHPVVFGCELFDDLLSAPLDQGAIAVVRQYQNQILHVETEEPGILIDIDTPEDYERFVLRAGGE